MGRSGSASASSVYATISRRLRASCRRCCGVSDASQSASCFTTIRRFRKSPKNTTAGERSTRRWTWTAVAALLLAAACAGPRPIHPYRLAGFPGAPIEPDLFPVRVGSEWVFEDRMAEGEKRLRLAIEQRGEELVLAGSKSAGATIRVRDGFIEIVAGGRVVERPLKLAGAVGDTWEVAGAKYTVFGYDEIEVLGTKRRALVVAADRVPVRDLYWFVAGIGWARIRTERLGAIKRDARLVEHRVAAAN